MTTLANFINSKPEEDRAEYLRVFFEVRMQPMREGGEFVATVPYTPLPLIEEIFSKIPTISEGRHTAKIAVLYTIEMAMVLHVRGFTDITVIVREHDEKLMSICTGHDFTYLLESEIGDMKFDVVVGNPPYQNDDDAQTRKNSTKPLWFDFTRLVFDITISGGEIAFITPSSWLQQSSKINKTITSRNVKEVLLFAKSPFAGVSTTASVWFVQNSPNDGEFVVNIEDRQYTYSVTSYMPAKPTNFATEMSILSKTVNAATPKLNVVIDSRNHTQTKQDKISKECTGDFIHPFVHTNTCTMYTNVIDDLHGCPKVIATKTGSITGAKVATEFSIGQNAIAMLTTSNDEAEVLLTILLSKLYKALFQIVRHSSTIPANFWRALPAVDLTRTWTDAQLYQHFNLTQEEIDLIEASV